MFKSRPARFCHEQTREWQNGHERFERREVARNGVSTSDRVFKSRPARFCDEQFREEQSGYRDLK